MAVHGNINRYTAKTNHSQLFYSHQSGCKLQLSVEIICHCPADYENLQRKAVQHPPAYPHAPWQGDDYFGYIQQRTLHTADKADYTQLYHPGGKLSVATNLYAYKGDYDSQLQWPFKEEVTISMYYISMIICTTHTVNILHNGIHTYMHVYCSR